VNPDLPDRVASLAGRLVEVPGVVAVVLGGSRATGQHRPDSDVDLGLYYRGGLGVASLRRLADELADEVLGLAEPGGWGRWVDGGAWLVVDGVRVDWIYRDLDRAAAIWADCQAGRYEIGVQAGHPLGFYSHAYPAEIALCRVLADPSGELTALREATRRYPDALAAALVAATWEPDLLLYGAESHGVATDDVFFIAGCLYRTIGVLAHALHAHHRSWVTHEKRLIDTAGRLRDAPREFAGRAHGILGQIGRTPGAMAAAITGVKALVAHTRAALGVGPAAGAFPGS
jgi:hypothetical protein